MKIKKIAALVLTGALALSTVQGAFAQEAAHSGLKNVIHAAGVIDGHIGTNSMEGVKSCFFNGYRYIELDFCFTTDNHLVSVHDWDNNYFGSDYAPYFNGAVSLAEFRAQKIIGKYTPITLDLLQSWIEGKPETFIITDIKERNLEGLKYIKQYYPVLASKIIPQVYSEEEFFETKELGFEHIIYTLYALTYSEKADAERINTFARENGVFAVVFDKTLATADYVNRLKSGGVKLYTHTVNDKIEYEVYTMMGVDGVYSDIYL